mgnify:CR=1 FL=1
MGFVPLPNASYSRSEAGITDPVGDVGRRQLGAVDRVNDSVDGVPASMAPGFRIRFVDCFVSIAQLTTFRKTRIDNKLRKCPTLVR